MNNFYNIVHYLPSFYMNSIVDFYVPIIDNYWDIWFALNLALIMTSKDQNLKVRFFSDDENLFKKMIWNEKENIQFINLKELNSYTPSKSIFTFFDYRLPNDYLKKWEAWKNIIQFWYFLLHKWIENLHWTTYEVKWDKYIHFIPSLTEWAWWIIIWKELGFKKWKSNKKDFINYINLKYNIQITENIIDKKWISVFVYKNTLNEVLEAIKERKNENEFYFVFDWEKQGLLQNSNLIFMPFLELLDYNYFLSICDINIVRWENSLCTSLSYWKPTLWDIYKENNKAHLYKIEDFISFFLTFDKKSIQYEVVIRDFNSWFSKEVIKNFIKNNQNYKDIFQEVKNYIIKNCNLLTNLNNIWKQKK